MRKKRKANVLKQLKALIVSNKKIHVSEYKDLVNLNMPYEDIKTFIMENNIEVSKECKYLMSL